MAHSRIWESGSTYCFYQPKQLMGMILNWEPDYLNFSTENFDYALGIYTDKYFSGFGKYRRSSFGGTVGETSISLLNPKATANSSNFVDNSGYRFNVHFSYEKKLWNDGNALRMLQIDAALIQAKLLELTQRYGRAPNTLFRWPLSFSVETNAVQAVLSRHGVDASFISYDQKKLGDRIG